MTAEAIDINFYFVLGLEFDPPVEDEKTIDDAIMKKQKEWSNSATLSGDKAALSKMYLERLDSTRITPNIRKGMKDPAIRAQHAKMAIDIVSPPINKRIKSMARTSQSGELELKENYLERISTAATREIERYNYKITPDLVKKYALRLKVKIVTSETNNTINEQVYKEYYETKPDGTDSFESSGRNLNKVQKNTFYDFLDLSDKVDITTLLNKSRELKQSIKGHIDDESSRISKLCDACEKIFKTESDKNKYDGYIQWKKRRIILEDAKTIWSSEQIPADQRINYIGQLNATNLEKTIAESLFDTFCQKNGIIYNQNTVSSASLASLRICRNCGAPNDISNGRKTCLSCGTSLSLSCPGCGKTISIESGQNFCPHCNYDLRNIDKARALYTEAEKEITKLNYDIAERFIQKAETYWQNNSESRVVIEKLSKSKQDYGDLIISLQKAVTEKRYVSAKNSYYKLKRLVPGYSDFKLEEEIKKAISEAASYCAKAQSLNSEKDILDICSKAAEICSDSEDVTKLAHQYPPQSPTNIRITSDSSTKVILLQWDKSQSNGSLYYRIIRKIDTVPLDVNDGEDLGRVGMNSFKDENVSSGTCYYYGIFTERAGIFSPPLTHPDKPALCLFEIGTFRCLSKDGQVQLEWARPPNGATVMLFRSSSNEKESQLSGMAATGYLDKGLTNDCDYTYCLRLSYTINGTIETTKGVTLTATPTSPPNPIDEMSVKLLKDDIFEAKWENPENAEITFYCSNEPPEYECGEIIPKSELEKSMHPLIITFKNETTGNFTYNGEEVLYVVPVVLKSGTAAFGMVARARKGGDFSINDVQIVNGKITIWLQSLKPMHGVTRYFVLSRSDKFPSAISDPGASKISVPIKKYLETNTLTIPNPEKRDYYICVFAEFKNGGIIDYSDGAEYCFCNGSKAKIVYSIEPTKKLFGDKSVTLTFVSTNSPIRIPDLDIYASIGHIPMFKDRASLLCSIPAQDGKGSSVTLTIPIPKGTPKNTHIKPFIHDESLNEIYDFSLKFNSSTQIT